MEKELLSILKLKPEKQIKFLGESFFGNFFYLKN